MPGIPVDVGHGTTVEFLTTGFSAELTSLRLVGAARRELDASHMAVPAAGAQAFGNRPYVRGRLVNPGQLVLGIHFAPDTNPPLHAPPETLAITWPIPPGDDFASLWRVSGFLVDLAITDSLDEVMVGTLTVQLTGEVTRTLTGSYPLDELPGATGAWSTRKLTSAYEASCLRVRRSSDNAELDIGFSGAALDTETLLAFVGAGDGYVRTWYDQSGVGATRDFAHASAAQQPQIVSSGAVLTGIGGQPALVFNGTSTWLQTQAFSSTMLTVSAGTVCIVFQATAVSTANTPAYDNDAVWCNADDQVGAHLHSTTPSVRAINQDVGGLDVATQTIAVGTAYVHTWRHGSSLVTSALNSATVGASAASGNTSALNTALRIGRNYESGPVQGYYDGALAEMITYNTALSAGDLDTLGVSMAQPYGIAWV